MTSLFGNDTNLTLKNNSAVLPQLHFPAKAKRVIFLCMAEGPSHVDLFDYKPLLTKLQGQNLADHLKIPRLSGMTSGKKSFIAGAMGGGELASSNPLGALYFMRYSLSTFS